MRGKVRKKSLKSDEVDLKSYSPEVTCFCLNDKTIFKLCHFSHCMVVSVSQVNYLPLPYDRSARN